MNGSRWLRLRYAVIAASVAACVGIGVWILRTYEPTQQSWYPKCAFYHWTGLHCPGCGATRALRSLVHGDFIMAVRYNALLIVGLPMMMLAITWQRRQERRGKRSLPQLAWFLAILVSSFLVLRNVPTPTRSWLAPPSADPERGGTPLQMPRGFEAREM